MAAEYYILDARTCVGNCALWWAPEGKGYTCNLKEAGLFTLEEAESNRITDVPVHKDVAEKIVMSHVQWDHLREAGVDIFAAHQRSITATAPEARMIRDVTVLGRCPVGTPMKMERNGAAIYGRLFKHGGHELDGCSPILTMITPNGSMYRAGLIWFSPLDDVGLAKLREYERMATRWYNGKLDHLKAC